VQFNVSSLLKETTGATREYDIDDDVAINGAPRRVKGRVRFDRTPDGILVRARLRGTMESDCSRCLRPLTFPVSVEFDEEYIPTIDILHGGRVEPREDEEDAYRIDERHFLDLREPLDQYWQMALPMAPVCREDCAGLCPDCGGEIGADGHECSHDHSDARWAKLRNLKLG
jgi:uncharacterized protein